MEERDKRQDGCNSKNEQNEWSHKRIENEFSKPLHEKVEYVHSSIRIELALQFQADQYVKPVALKKREQ